MPRVPKGFGRSVVHLYETPDAAEAGEPYGGTGFLVVVQGRDIPKPLEVFTNRNEQYAYEGDRTLARSLYVVTARHVVTGGATVIRFNMLPTTPGSFKLETDLDDWKQWEEHDLAILAVEIDPSHVDFDAIPATRLAHEPLPRSFESNNWPQPGDDVFMVGRFVERSGRPHNEVQVRFGNVSMVSEDPIQTKAGELVGYLVEMHQRSGFSGSPVFQFRPSYGAVIGGSDGMAHASLLGVDQGAYPESFGVFTKNGGETNLEFRGPSPLAVVIPAARIVDLLMSDEELVVMRKEKQDKHDDDINTQPESTSAQRKQPSESPARVSKTASRRRAPGTVDPRAGR